jgi:adenosylhomocysteine nucleosidase
VRTDSLLTVDRVATTAADKRSLAAAFGAIALDMESAAVAAVAREHGVPFLAVRAIADPEDFALPAAVLKATDARGIVRRSVLLGHLLLHPSELSSLLRLASHFRAALGALRHAADALGPDMLLGEALDKRFRT